MSSHLLPTSEAPLYIVEVKEAVVKFKVRMVEKMWNRRQEMP